MHIQSLKPYFRLPAQACFSQEQIQARLQVLQEKLTKHKPTILQRLQHSEKLNDVFNNLQTDKAQFINSYYEAATAMLAQTDSATPFSWLSLYQQAQSAGLTHEQVIQLYEQFLQIAYPALGDRDFLAGVEYLQNITQAAEFSQQRYQINFTYKEIAQQIFTKIPALCIEDSSRSESLDIIALERDFAAFLKEWSEIEPTITIAGDLEFIVLFMLRLVANHNATDNLWEIIILRLDRLLTNHVRHALAPTLEALLAAVPRFKLARSFMNQVMSRYEGTGAPIGELLLLLTLLQARTDSQLHLRFLQEMDCLPWVKNITISSEKLAQLHFESIELLRPEWERFQLDWIREAIESLSNLFHFTQLGQIFIEQTQNEIENYTTALTENLTEADSQEIITLFKALVREACFAAAITENPVLAKNVFRIKATLALDPDKHSFIWKKQAEIISALQRLHTTGSELRNYTNAVNPIIASLSEVIQDNFSLPIRWFGDIETLSEITKKQQDTPLIEEEIEFVLQSLAAFRRLYNQYLTTLKLKTWYANHLLLSPNKIESKIIFSIFEQIDHYFQKLEPSSNSVLRKTLTRFVENLPLATLSINLVNSIEQIVSAATTHVRQKHPDYALRVGETGMQLCFSDTHFLLSCSARVLSDPIENPKEILCWLWSTAALKYIVNIDENVFEDNLIGLKQAISKVLEPKEVECLLKLLRLVYVETLGIKISSNFDKLSVPSVFHFKTLEVRGPVWNQLFDQYRVVPKYVRYIQNCLPDFPVDPSVKIQLEGFIELYLQYGDEEYAWQEIQPLFEVSLQTQTTLELETQWRQMLYYLPNIVMPITQIFYWMDIMQRGLQVIRQVGLGLKMKKWSQECIQQINLSELKPNDYLYDFSSPEHNFQKDLCLFVKYSGNALKSQASTLAILNIGRYLVEKIIPFVKFPVCAWQLIWLQLEAALSTYLDCSEKIALTFFIAQLDAKSENLPEAHTISRAIFSSQSHVFAKNINLEEQWRSCISGVITAAITPSHAPVNGQMLTQRLLLSSSVFEKEKVESWRYRERILTEAFEPVLNNNLDALLNSTHKQLITSLSTLHRLIENDSLNKTEIFCAVLYHLAYARRLWLNEIWMRYTHENLTAISHNIIISHITGWIFPEIDTFKQASHICQSACDFDSKIKIGKRKWAGLGKQLVELTDQQHNEVKLFLHILALHTAFQTRTFNLVNSEKWLLEMFLYAFANYNSEQKELIIRSLLVNLARMYTNSHRLTYYVQSLLKTLPTITLSEKLLNKNKIFANFIVSKSNLKNHVSTKNIDQEDYVASCEKEISFFLKLLGLHFSNVRVIEIPRDWYQSRANTFPNIHNQNIEAKFFLNMPKKLHKELIKTESVELEKFLSAMFSTAKN